MCQQRCFLGLRCAQCRDGKTRRIPSVPTTLPSRTSLRHLYRTVRAARPVPTTLPSRTLLRLIRLHSSPAFLSCQQRCLLGLCCASVVRTYFAWGCVPTTLPSRTLLRLPCAETPTQEGLCQQRCLLGLRCAVCLHICSSSVCSGANNVAF
mgnify:CR=1 FL=1